MPPFYSADVVDFDTLGVSGILVTVLFPVRRILGGPCLADTDVVVPVVGVVSPLLLLPAPTAFALACPIGAVTLIWVLRPKGECAATCIAGFCLHASLREKDCMEAPSVQGTSICRSTSRAQIFVYCANNDALTVLAEDRRVAYTALRTLWLQCWISSSEAHAQVWAFVFLELSEKLQIRHGPLLCVR